MLIAFWIVNGLLAIVFVGAGLMKVIRPRAALADSGMGYVEDFSSTQVKLIGFVEILGAIGLVLPMLLDIAPVLTPVAAVALAATMFVAASVHMRRKESPAAPLVLGSIAALSAILGFLIL
ncbi:DoxX family protein [Nesterenkonia populi]